MGARLSLRSFSKSLAMAREVQRVSCPKERRPNRDSANKLKKVEYNLDGCVSNPPLGFCFYKINESACYFKICRTMDYRVLHEVG